MSSALLLAVALMCVPMPGMSLPSPVGSARFGRTSSLHGFRHRLNASLQQSGLLQSASLLQSGSMREATAGLTATACWAQSDRQPAPQELVHRRITGDGRCLFRALAQGDYRLATGGAELPLAQETSRADKIRDQICDEMLSRQDDLAPFIDEDFDDYVENMRQPHTWGDEPEVSMAPHVLQRPVDVYSRGQLAGSYEPEGKAATKQPVQLLFDGVGHYDLLCQRQPASKL